MSNPKQMIDKRFGKLVVIERAENNKFGHICWKCQCDCGRICITSGSYLRRGSTTSCGCINQKALRTADGTRIVMRKYACNAIDRGKFFGLSEEQFRNIISKDCFYCGEPPAQRVNIGGASLPNFWYNGIDRLNNDEGYTESNSVPCCGTCNKAKGVKSHQEFMEYIDKLIEFRTHRGASNVQQSKQDRESDK